MTRTARVRCVRVRLAGTMNGTWTEPAWNPLGAGWSDLAIDDTSMVVTTTDDCWSEGTAADVDDYTVCLSPRSAIDPTA